MDIFQRLKELPEDIWTYARQCSEQWINNGGDVVRWQDAIKHCQAHYPQYSKRDIQTAFELERDEAYIKYPHEDDFPLLEGCFGE